MSCRRCQILTKCQLFIILNLHTSLFGSISTYFCILSAALFPQAGEASIQPDASDCSCEGSHKEQQSLGCALGVPTRGWSPACDACVHAGRGLGVWVVGDMTATAQGGGGGLGYGICVTCSDSTRTKDPQASYVGRTSGLAASPVMLLNRPCLLVYFSSTLYM